VTALVTAVHEHFGRIAVLVNNAKGEFIAATDDVSVNGSLAVQLLSVEAV